MAIVVLGKHDSEPVGQKRRPRRRPPAELRAVPPPDVQLSEDESEDRAGRREMPARGRKGDVGEGAEQSVGEDRGIEGQHGVIPIGAAAIVMRSQVQLEPDVLRHVVKKR